MSRQLQILALSALAVVLGAIWHHTVPGRRPDQRLREMMAGGAGVDAALQVATGALNVDDPALLSQLALSLPRGEDAGNALAIGVLERALALCQRPGYQLPTLGALDAERKDYPLRLDNRIRARLAVLYWERGRKDEARAQVRAALAVDPGSLLFAALVQRFDKQVLSPRALTGKRRVKFSVAAAGLTAPQLSGSWNVTGTYDQLGGWAREPMQPESANGRTRFVLERELTVDAAHWFAAVLHDGPGPDARRPALARFPVVGTSTDTLEVDLDTFGIEPPHAMFAPRPPRPPPAPAPARPPRVVLLCVDSATWNVVMPLVKAGMMPRLERLMPRAAIGIIDSPVPITGVVFYELNFGKSDIGTGQALWMNAMVLLKERGLETGSGVSIAGQPNTWQTMAKAGVSTLYASLGERVSYAAGGKETVHTPTADPATATIAGQALVRDEDIVRAFLPQSERAGFDGLKTSDAMVIETYHMATDQFPWSFELFRKLEARVSLIHVGFVDYSYHNAWWSMDPPERWLSGGPVLSRRYAHVIQNAHRLADVMIGELADCLDLTRDSLVIWSDHGAAGGLLARDMGHARDGMIVGVGPLFAPGVLPGTFPVSGLAPTICAALGLPPLPGHETAAVLPFLAPRPR